eukprot:2565675-Rhodomonas_salina.1
MSGTERVCVLVLSGPADGVDGRRCGSDPAGNGRDAVCAASDAVCNGPDALWTRFVMDNALLQTLHALEQTLFGASLTLFVPETVARYLCCARCAAAI